MSKMATAPFMNHIWYCHCMWKLVRFRVFTRLLCYLFSVEIKLMNQQFTFSLWMCWVY